MTRLFILKDFFFSPPPPPGLRKEQSTHNGECSCTCDTYTNHVQRVTLKPIKSILRKIQYEKAHFSFSLQESNVEDTKLKNPCTDYVFKLAYNHFSLSK